MEYYKEDISLLKYIYTYMIQIRKYHDSAYFLMTIVTSTHQ